MKIVPPVAEHQLQFEHRDLHWGNILIRDTEDKVLEYALDKDTVYEVKTEKTKATIIDFSLSRLTSTKDKCVLFNDLSKDPELFQAQGDYQFDIYRSVSSPFLFLIAGIKSGEIKNSHFPTSFISRNILKSL